MASLLQTAFPTGPAAEADTPPGASPRSFGDGTAEVSDLWRILRHRRGLILAVTALLLGATLAYGLLTPHLYTATAQILVDPRDRQVVSNDVNPSTVAPDGGVTQVESQVSVVQSTGVLLRAIAATDLTKDPEFNGVSALHQALVRFGLASPRPAEGTSDAEARTLDNLRRALTVKRADKVLVIDLSVTAKSAEKSARIANAIADAYLADQANARAAAADAASAALSARLAEQRRRVREAEDAVERYRSQNNLVVATGQLVSERQLSDVNDQLLAAQSRVATLKAKVDQIRQARDGGLSPDATAEAIGSPVIAKLREQESTLAQREADLSAQLGPKHPSIAAVDMEVRRIHQSIRAELDRVARSVQSDYDRARANAAALATRLDTMKSQTLANDQASVRLMELQRERDAVRSVYASYLLRVQETREQANVDSTNARIISEALVPQQASWPPVPLLLAGALCCGLGLGAAMALIAEYIRPTLLSVGQAEAVAGAPVVGVLPLPAAVRRRRFKGFRRAPQPDARLSLPGGRFSPTTQDKVIMTLRRLFGAEPERRDRQSARSLVLVSGGSDGATRDRLAQLLALTASQQGERVLFVDADLSGGQQSGAAGLLDVLRGECSLDSVVQYDTGGRLAMMPKGRQQAVARYNVERIFANRMLADARAQFDLVIIDGGQATENVKVAPLAQAAQQVCIVAQLAVTSQADIHAAVQMMQISGCPVTAVLLVGPAHA